jgi:malic enzyme
MAEITNREKKAGSLADVIVGADVFIGVSAPGTLTTEMVKTMNKDAIVFACANPTPEIFPEDAKAGTEYPVEFMYIEGDMFTNEEMDKSMEKYVFENWKGGKIIVE